MVCTIVFICYVVPIGRRSTDEQCVCNAKKDPGWTNIKKLHIYKTSLEVSINVRRV